MRRDPPLESTASTTGTAFKHIAVDRTRNVLYGTIGSSGPLVHRFVAIDPNTQTIRRD